MSGYRIGDRRIVAAGEPVRLRLSVSALAEIAVHFAAEDAQDLAVKLRGAGAKDWNAVYAALATPRPLTALTDSELAQILPEISLVIAEGLKS